MNRNVFLLVAVLSAGAAVAARAGPVEDSIVRQLREQGYSEISVSRTFLGRSRITANTDEVDREIVVNPRTGEILRDYWKARDGGELTIFNPGGKTEDDSDDNDDNDDNDDDRSGRNSGSGENSGSGGGDDSGDNLGTGGGDDSDSGGDDNSGSGGGDDGDD